MKFEVVRLDDITKRRGTKAEPWSPITLIGHEKEEMVKETEKEQLVRHQKNSKRTQ